MSLDKILRKKSRLQNQVNLPLFPRTFQGNYVASILVLNWEESRAYQKYDSLKFVTDYQFLNFMPSCLWQAAKYGKLPYNRLFVVLSNHFHINLP